MLSVIRNLARSRLRIRGPRPRATRIRTGGAPRLVPSALVRNGCWVWAGRPHYGMPSSPSRIHTAPAMLVVGERQFMEIRPSSSSFRGHVGLGGIVEFLGVSNALCRLGAVEGLLGATILLTVLCRIRFQGLCERHMVEGVGREVDGSPVVFAPHVRCARSHTTPRCHPVAARQRTKDFYPSR